MGKTAERLYGEREKRVTDAIELRTPDRVPIIVRFHFFPARYTGATAEELMYDPRKTEESYWKVVRDFEPDMIQNPFERFLGPLLDALDCRQARWPGRNLPAHLPYQFVEQEYMKTEEYDHLLSDPSDFIVRRLWPRIFGALKGFEKLRPLHGAVSYSVGMQTAFGEPEVLESLGALRKVAEESIKLGAYSGAFRETSRREGFPIEAEAATQAPFDFLADFFRGTKGLMVDMYRKPQVVVKACEKVLPFLVERAVVAARASGNPRIFIPLHKGVDSAMSREQYLNFYWPTLRELMLALIAEGLCPCPFFEGDYTSRLDIIKDMPAGKVCYKFERVDLVEARDVLGKGICLRGGVPVSLLVTGTPERVREHCRKLIEVVAKKGPFIMDASSGLDDAKPENVRAFFDATREYGG
ncbi:MAG TPA: uroporphyrinogen decarboxylase family protein [Thermodesulfobacteriota bacterium]|nr:uroporphyrinogen decarboxylase family protein [Thermodesulfobacteriota bacterium]